MSFFEAKKNKHIFASVTGGMAEWSNAAVLKTVDCNRSGGSNPSFSAKETHNNYCGFFYKYRNLIFSASFLYKIYSNMKFSTVIFLNEINIKKFIT